MNAELDTDTEISVKYTLVRILRGSGFTEKVASAFAEDLAPKICLHFGGRYFPKRPASGDALRQDVLEDFTGNNHDEVCAKHGISRRTLYRMLGG